jgi:hypothetical protein
VSEAGNTRPASVNEAEVERAVREILAPLDRGIEWLNNLMAGLWFCVVTPGVTILLMWQFGFSVWGAMSCGFFGGLIGLVVIFMNLEGILARRALRHFERRFPEGSPERPVARTILDEMETPSKAEQKLRELLQAATPAERIVRHRRADPEAGVDAALNQVPPATSAASAASPPTPAPPPIMPKPAAGGIYDYIPLKPREAPPGGDKPA